MNPNQNRLDSRVYNMASNLFGIHDKRSELVELPQTIAAEPGRIMAIWPAITQDAFALTMDAYRLYISKYNFRTRAENDIIHTHNKAVKAHCKANPLDDTQSKLVAMFQFRNKAHRFARDYNKEVDEFCAQYGPLVQKRPIPTVKYHTEIVFQNFLHLYNCQLMRRNEEYIRLNVTTPRPLQELKINAHLVTKLKRNEVQSLALCKKSVRNHRIRLEECGILIDYSYKGSWTGVETHLNPEIVHFVEMKTGEIVDAENQRISLAKRKVLPDANDSTRPSINEYERNANVNNSPNKEFAALTPKPFVFYKDTQGNEAIPELPPPPDGVKISEIPPQLREPQRRAARPVTPSQVLGISGTAENDCSAGIPPKKLPLSDRLASLILHPQDLAERLAAGEYYNYNPIDLRLLDTEAHRGTLSREEFRELVIQDFFKTAAKLYRSSTPYVGSWKIALNLYYENKFVDWQGNPFNKYTYLKDIEELRWRLVYAFRWFDKHPVKPLFPNQYFDFTRKTNREVGFEYTKRAWQKHVTYLETKELRKKKAERLAEARNKRINYTKRIETEIRKFFRDKIPLHQLTENVARHYPPEFRDKLPDLIEKIGLKYTNRK